MADGKILALTSALEKFIPGVTGAVTDDIHRMRDLVSQARRLYLKSLAQHRTTRIAYDGLTAQLRAAGDDDTSIMVAQAYLGRVAPREALEVAVDIADVHIRHGRFRAAAAICERILPVGTLSQRYDAGRVSHA